MGRVRSVRQSLEALGRCQPGQRAKMSQALKHRSASESVGPADAFGGLEPGSCRRIPQRCCGEPAAARCRGQGRAGAAESFGGHASPRQVGGDLHLQAPAAEEIARSPSSWSFCFLCGI